MPRRLLRPRPARRRERRAWAIAVGVLLALPCPAATLPALQVLHDGPDGATCRHFNAGGRLAWRVQGGDWRDAGGLLHGAQPYAVARITGEDAVVRWAVGAMVREAAARGERSLAVLLRRTDGTGGVDFHTREAAAGGHRPTLLVTLGDGRGPLALRATADAGLDCSTARTLGGRASMRVHGHAQAVAAFDLAQLRGERPMEATLELAVRSRHGDGLDVGAFALAPPVEAVRANGGAGLAAAFPGDAGIERHPAVLMATGFESEDWRRKWSPAAFVGRAERVGLDAGATFDPIGGHALRVRIPKGRNTGLDLSFRFAERTGEEPQAVWFRYYLRFARDWIADVDGGKLPGLAGTYGRAGWGGRPADPLAGWSLRGHFNRAPLPGNPMRGLVTLATYAYHADMEGRFGDEWPWTLGGHGVLERERWYCIEQHVRLNTPGVRDGVLRAWVDGALALARDDVRLRDVEAVRIERVWMNVYHGGTAPPARDMHLDIDNVVIARERIGCMP